MITFGMSDKRWPISPLCHPTFLLVIYLRWGRDIYAWRHGGVYLRWFRLHSAGVVCVYLRWLLQSCLHNSTQDLGHLPAVLQTLTCGAWGCLPPVGRDVYADGMGGCLPAVLWENALTQRGMYTSGGSCGCACNYRPLIGSSTCGATKTSTSGGKIL